MRIRLAVNWALAAAALAVVCAPAARADFGYRKKITIQSSQVSNGPLTNLPMLFSVTDNDLRTSRSGGHVRNSSGYDIAFRASNGLSDLG